MRCCSQGGEIVSHQPAREPANNPRTDIGAGEADARTAYQRTQPTRQLECPLVQRAPGEVIVKNADPAVIFHEGTDFTKKISKVGEIVDRQVAQTQIKLRWAPKDLPIQSRSEHARRNRQISPAKFTRQ